MFSGETVYVSLLTLGEEDRLRNASHTYAEPVAVHNVVVAPGKCDALDASRPDGVDVALTLHFPRGYAHDLRGAKVTVRDDTYRIVGDPQRLTEANVPGAWTMPVEVERVDG